MLFRAALEVRISTTTAAETLAPVLESFDSRFQEVQLFDGYFNFFALFCDLRILALEKAKIIQCVFDRALFHFVKPGKLVQGFHPPNNFGARLRYPPGHEGLFQLEHSGFVQLHPFFPIVIGHSQIPPVGYRMLAATP